jgi:hypothetical protein
MRLFLALFWLVAGPAYADCEGFKWSVAGEKTWFAAAPEPLDAGGAAETARAYEIALKPAAQAEFAVAPKQAANPGEFGGVVRVEIARAGTFQVTTTREVWVDVVQGGALERVRGVSRQRDCPSFVKSVRFTLRAGPATIQFSRSKEATLGFAVAPGS